AAMYCRVYYGCEDHYVVVLVNTCQRLSGTSSQWIINCPTVPAFALAVNDAIKVDGDWSFAFPSHGAFPSHVDAQHRYSCHAAQGAGPVSQMKDTSMPTRSASRKSPVVPEKSELRSIPSHEFDFEMTIERGLLLDVVVYDDRFRHGMVDKSRLEVVTVSGVNAEGLIVRHTALERCDWSNTSVESPSWSDAIFEGCKLTGVKLNLAVFKNVELHAVRADLVQ